MEPSGTQRERQSDIADDLLLPAAYGVPRPRRIARIDTHISWVFVVDEDVYKIKRPVDFGFLDFTSLAQRKGACDAEVRLNARLAPDVYQGVVPIKRVGDGPAHLGGAGPSSTGPST